MAFLYEKKVIIKYLWIKYKYGLQELLMIIRIWMEHKWCEETVEKDCAHGENTELVEKWFLAKKSSW